MDVILQNPADTDWPNIFKAAEAAAPWAEERNLE